MKSANNQNNNQKKRFWLVFSLVFVVAIGIYLNRAFSHIYSMIGAADLKNVNMAKTYIIDGVVGGPEAGATATYVALGDSLTAGVGAERFLDSYSYLLAQRFAENGRRIILHSLATPGMKSGELLEKYVPEAIAASPDVITLLIGVNDIHDWVTVKDFRRNYEKILQRLVAETPAAIYVINIPYIGADGAMFWPPYNYWFNYRTREFNGVIKELTAQYDVRYLDLYTPTLSLFKTPGAHYSRDFFHPAAAGYKIWADLLYDYIRQ